MATLFALKNKAKVCHVDSSRPTVNWAKENVLINNFYLPFRRMSRKFMEGNRGGQIHRIQMDVSRQVLEIIIGVHQQGFDASLKQVPALPGA